ncbi:alcohol dehydrogenase [Lineolata rhizophorae]|uniref:Alcohol dehydrogenase n=1 Tax=Lineolata rhizophorae TaxID=578093 RepID=A0A6A6P2W5_9PEZI|nr:alcohol dehydrogenase [Lineolata rhizophorae]
MTTQIESLDLHGIDSSVQGHYTASPVKHMIYGLGAIQNLLSLVQSIGASKAFIITGRSLSKTPVIKQVQSILGDAHAGTFNEIGQHAPIDAIRKAITLFKESSADILVSVGGGSPIDSAKVVAHTFHGDTGKWIPQIAVPTTLSVAETTQNAGFTNDEGQKVGISDSELVPKAVLYDGELALHTPIELWTSTGLRALDHALELLYHPQASEFPTKRLGLEAIRDLFAYLPASKAKPEDVEVRQRLLIAAYGALFPFLYRGSVGLSHSIGHAVGAAYGIPHGITSCMSLAPVLHHKADSSEEAARQIARALPYIGKKAAAEGNHKAAAHAVADAVDELVTNLGLKRALAMYNVPPGQEEAIAIRGLRSPEHPDLEACKKIVRGLY